MLPTGTAEVAPSRLRDFFFSVLLLMGHWLVLSDFCWSKLARVGWIVSFTDREDGWFAWIDRNDLYDSAHVFHGWFVRTGSLTHCVGHWSVRYRSRELHLVQDVKTSLKYSCTVVHCCLWSVLLVPSSDMIWFNLIFFCSSPRRAFADWLGSWRPSSRMLTRSDWTRFLSREGVCLFFFSCRIFCLSLRGSKVGTFRALAVRSFYDEVAKWYVDLMSSKTSVIFFFNVRISWVLFNKSFHITFCHALGFLCVTVFCHPPYLGSICG